MRTTTALVLLFLCGALADDSDLVGEQSVESASSPLAKLLATASGVGAPILPLAPQHFRPKRKPQRFSLGGERPRFKPRGRQQKPERPAEETNEIPATEEPPRKKFSGFRGRRPSPPRFQPQQQPQETTEAELETVPPTEPSRFQGEDFFGTPEPVVLAPSLVDELVETDRSIPIPLSNSVGNEQNILDEVRARTIAITGAQPVGVTKDITHRAKGARKLSAGRRDGVRKQKAG